MQPIIESFAEDSENIILTLFLLLGSSIAVIAIAFRSANIKARERTRREIAAYIAEGSMTPEQGEKLLQAARPKD